MRLWIAVSHTVGLQVWCLLCFICTPAVNRVLLWMLNKLSRCILFTDDIWWYRPLNSLSWCSLYTGVWGGLVLVLKVMYLDLWCVVLVFATPELYICFEMFCHFDCIVTCCVWHFYFESISTNNFLSLFLILIHCPAMFMLLK